MNRTRAVDNVAVLPAPTGNTHAAGYFDVGTTVDHEQMNMMQEAIVRPLEDGGVTPDTDNYDQFAVLLSGVHGIVTDVRSNLATTGASTYSKRAASAVLNAFADGDYSQCNAGVSQAANGDYSQCNAGVYQHAGGDCSQCNAGTDQTAHGFCSQCNAGKDQTADGNYSQCNAGMYQINFGEYASVIGGKYFENIDNNCVCGGYGAAAPANHGDGLTNKNIKWKLHNDTGNAEFAGDVQVEGKIKNAAGADVTFDDGIDVEGAVTAQGGLKITHETTSAAWDTDHWEATLARRAASITIDFSAHNLASGGSVTLDIAAAGVSTYARCYGVFDNMGGPPPLITQFARAGSVSLTLWNVGVAAITTSAVLCVDIIDRA